jgi:hypothetical protein
VKTISLKKVSAVAVAALAMTGFSTVSASAAGTAETITCTTAYNTTSCTQVIGGSGVITFKASDDTTVYTITSSGVGSIGAAALSVDGTKTLVGTATSATFPNTGLDFTAGADNETAALTLTSAIAGTQTITVVKKDANGTPTSTYTKSLTWVTAASTGISAANSSLYVDTDADGCVAPGASKAADTVLISAASALSRTPAATAVDVCVIARDVNENLLTVASATVTGSFGRSDVTPADTGSDKSYDFDLAAASSLLTGTETITAVVIDSFGNAAVLTVSLSVYGSLKTLAISALRGSAYAAADQTAPVDTYAGAAAAAYTSNDIIVGVKATDSNSATIDLSAASQANSTATSAWTVDSDKVAGVPADRTAQTLGASVVTMNVSGELSSSKWGTNAAYITCSTKPEKLTVTAWGKNSDGAWLKSNSLDVYCAGAPSTVTVTPSATSVTKTDSPTVNVSVKDADGYLVADGTAVTLAANNGAVVAPSSKTTVNGAFTTAATLIVGSDSSSTTVSAIAGSKTGTATVNVSGGSSTTSLTTQIDALNAKIVALNALIAKIMKKLGVK